MPAAARGLEKIALCTAGDIITFIACGRAHLFPSPRERRERATIAAHAHLLCKSVGGWFRDSLSFLYSSLPFFSVEMLHPKLCSVDESQPAQPKNKRLICEVTLLTWPPSKILSVAKKRGLSRSARTRILKSVVVGAEEREEMKGVKMCRDVLHPRRSRP